CAGTMYVASQATSGDEAIVDAVFGAVLLLSVLLVPVRAITSLWSWKGIRFAAAAGVFAWGWISSNQIRDRDEAWRRFVFGSGCAILVASLPFAFAMVAGLAEWMGAVLRFTCAVIVGFAKLIAACFRWGLQLVERTTTTIPQRPVDGEITAEP